MAMNINRIQSQLQRVPDQALIGYVQNPDGQVPSFLALAELTRRKEIRNAPQAQQAPTQTVAQQAVVEAEPGIDKLPLPETMFNEESMAAGGIVSFADGGDVQRFTKGGPPFVELTAAEILKLTPAQRTEYNNNMYAARQKGLLRGAKSLGASALDVGRLTYALPLAGLDMGTNALGEVVNTVAGREVMDTSPSALRQKGFGPNSDAFARANQLKKNIGFNVEGATEAPNMYNQLRQQPRPATSFLDNLPSSQGAPMNEAPVDQAPIAPTGTSSRGFTGTDFSVPDISAREVTFNKKDFDALKESPVTAEAEMARYKAMIGENEGLAALKGRLTGMETRAAKEEEQAPWLALTRAGLAIAAGRSQFPLQNIAEGAGVGITDYVAAKDRLANREEKRFGIQSQLAQAERAEQVAAATFGENSAQHVKAQNRAADLAALGAKTTIETTNASNALTAESANIKNKLTAKELGLTEKRYNDMYNVAMVQAEKSLQGIEKQTIQQQTQILNNLLDESNTRITKLNDDFSPGNADRKVEAEAQYNAIQKRLMQITGVKYTGPAAATGPRLKSIGSF